MASYVAVDKDGNGKIFNEYPERCKDLINSIEGIMNPKIWCGDHVEISNYYIEKLIGRKLTWEDEPVELKEE